MKKIIHISDTHGTFPQLPEGEFVVHSGDFLPNASRGNLAIEPKFQQAWVEARLDTFRDWLGGRTLLVCDGNHDFFNCCELLTANGITAIDLTNKLVTFQGISFYGFPYIPYIAGEWNYEKHLAEMNDELRYMREKVQDANVSLDFLVAHAPPWGVCDLYLGNHFGNTVLTNMLAYDQMQPLPKYILCGHIHEANGSANIFGIEISNAATRVHVIEYAEPGD
ncbi:MAG TPA: metallophosphoesterase [Anaerovoracaceae bacterium]|nr:metallophosphoesterase [Anaerovoracaceae bacterium]